MKENNLFYDQMKNIFKDEYEDFIKALKEPLSQSFFLNTLKGDKQDLFELIDFNYTNSEYNENSYYYKDLQID